MARFRNKSDETVLDALTQQVAAPDDVIEVDDSIAAAYEDHPIWEPVPDVGASVPATPAAPADTSETEEVAA